MTPDQAAQIIESIGTGGHTWCPADMRDTYEADALETIAGMTAEYRTEQLADGGTWLPLSGWYDQDTAQFFADMHGDGVTRVVRRYVTTPEVIP